MNECNKRVKVDNQLYYKPKNLLIDIPLFTFRRRNAVVESDLINFMNIDISLVK